MKGDGCRVRSMPTDDTRGRFALVPLSELRDLYARRPRGGRDEEPWSKLANLERKEPHVPAGAYGHVPQVVGGVLFEFEQVSVDTRRVPGRRTVLPYSFVARASGPRLPYPVTLVVRDRGDGHGYVLSDLHVHADAIQVGKLRTLKIAELVRAAVKAVGLTLEAQADDEWETLDTVPDVAWRDSPDGLEELVDGRPVSRARLISDALLGEVADVWRAAKAEGLYPTKAVREHFHIAESTASNWVKRARDAGYLGPPANTSWRGSEVTAPTNRKGRK